MTRMIRSRIKYWNCCKFADFIRGTKKPKSLTMEDWKTWRQKQQKERPWRYWASEVLLMKLQDFFSYPIDCIYKIKCYIRNRFITQTHNLKTDLKKGEWYDLDTRILHGLFNELVEFVEIELAHLNKWSRNKRYKFKHGRSVEAAYDYFEWATNLKFDETYGINPDASNYGELTPQAENTLKIKELYEWWTQTRKNRPDPYELFSRKDHGKKYYHKIKDLIKEYEDEDTQKLIEFIKIRDKLYT
jgi:hypothetical protein